MDRRKFLIGATGSVAALALAKSSEAGSHASHPAVAATASTVDPRVLSMRETTLACQQAAAECVRHCIERLGAGDEALAGCLRSVLRMQAVTAATHAVAAGEQARDPRTRQLVAVCADFCHDCAAECEPHAEMHAACKACLDACRRCVEACDAYAA